MVIYETVWLWGLWANKQIIVARQTSITHVCALSLPCALWLNLAKEAPCINKHNTPETKLTWRHGEDVRAEPTEHVRHSLAEGSGKRALLERRQLVGDDAAHLGQFSESVSHFLCWVWLNCWV